MSHIMETIRKILRLVKQLFLLFATLIALIFPAALWWWWGTSGVQVVAARWTPDANATQISSLGQTGDVFGGINALFAAYAFAGVAVAAFFQWRTWRVFSRQNQQEAFEPLFFHLLELNRELKPEKLRMDDVLLPLTYGQAIEALRHTVFPLIPQINQAGTREAKIQFVKGAYLPVYWKNEDKLGPYLRALFHTFSRIKSSELPLRKKLEYARIARATLGVDDLFLLLLNGCTELGRAFKPLIEEYGILKHIPKAPAGEPESGEQQLVDLYFERTASLSTRKRFAFWKKIRRQQDKSEFSLNSFTMLL